MQRSPTCQNCFRNFELQDCRPLGNRIPLLLPCGHTFCEGCILKVAKNNSEISCFKCNQKIELNETGDGGVKCILPNIYILGLLLYNWRIASEKLTGGNISEFNGYSNVIHKFNSLLSSSNDPVYNKQEEESDAKDLCGECCKNPPNCKCKICDSKLCEKCFKKVHQTTKTLKKHKPSPIELVSNESEQLCLQHGRKLEFYDKITSITVCAICIISEKCRGHEVVLLSEMKKNPPVNFDEPIKDAKETLFWWQYSSNCLKKKISEKCIDADSLFVEIQDKFNGFHTKLQNRQLQLMCEATETIVSNSAIHAKLSDVSKNIEMITSCVNTVKTNILQTVPESKSKEVIEKLKQYIDVPCIIDTSSVPTVDTEFQLVFDREEILSFKHFGLIKKRNDADMYTFKKISDVSKEFREQFKNDCVNKFVKVKKCNKLTTMDFISEEDKSYKLLVCVTDFIDPLEFKVQRVSDKQRLQSLMTNINKHCRYATSSGNLVQKVEEGQLFIAQFLSDNNWYRACITNKWCPDKADVEPTWSNGLTVEVMYIDYGNKERVPLTRLRQIPEKFLEVPALAISCSLVNIKPPGGLSKDWPKDTKKAFETLTGDYPLLMTVYKKMANNHFIDLCKPENDEKPQGNTDIPSSIRDGLVFLEVAFMLSSENSGTCSKSKQKRDFKPHEALAKNEFIDVTVTHVVNPDIIFIQNLTSKIADEQYHLGQVYTNAKNNKIWMIDYPYKNMVCSAKYSVDKAWYRAQVIKINKNNTVSVEFVDYGNRENLSFKDLRRIPDMYLNSPKQCAKVKLSNIKPQGKNKYSEETIGFLQKFFVGKSLVAVVKEFDKEIPLVEMYDTSTKEDVNMNELLQTFVMKGEEEIKGIVSDELKKLVLQIIDSEDESEDTGCKKTRFGYLPAEVPLSNRFSATGFYVDDDANIYLHVMNSNDMSVSDIVHHLNFDTKKFTNCVLLTTDGLQLKQAVVGKFSKDGLIYRAEVLQIVDEEKLIVNYVDIGVVEETDISNIFSEPVLLEVPRQTLSVCLTDIVPVDKKWSTGAIELLGEYIVGEIVDVEIQTKQKNCPSAVINVDDGSNMADILVKENMATHVKNNDELSRLNNNFNTVKLDYLWFTEQKLPKKGSRFPVMVTQVNQPDVVYIQRLPVDENGSFCGASDDDTATDAFNNLMLLGSLSEVINRKDFFKDQHLTLKPLVGMACVCMYSSDEVYYRARIEKIFNENDLVEVIYVDYGTSEIVTVDRLLPLPPDLIHLPMQSRKVNVSGIKPVMYDKSSEMLRDTKWSIEAMKVFFSIVADKRLIAEVVSTDNLPSIHLYLSTDSDRILKYVGHVMKDSKLSEFEI